MIMRRIFAFMILLLCLSLFSTAAVAETEMKSAIVEAMGEDDNGNYTIPTGIYYKIEFPAQIPYTKDGETHTFEPGFYKDYMPRVFLCVDDIPSWNRYLTVPGTWRMGNSYMNELANVSCTEDVITDTLTEKNYSTSSSEFSFDVTVTRLAGEHEWSEWTIKSGEHFRYCMREENLAPLKVVPACSDTESHEIEWNDWVGNGDDTHTRTCADSDCTFSESGDCTGGQATTTQKAVCTYCGEEYGSVLPPLPETGDEANLVLWSALLAMSFVGMMLVRKQREA